MTVLGSLLDALFYLVLYMCIGAGILVVGFTMGFVAIALIGKILGDGDRDG